jgi:hypothetical protein
VAVALRDLVPSLRRAVNPPGGDLHPGTGANEWRGRLADAFWNARLADFFAGYAISADGAEIVALAGTTPEDLDRTAQQLIVRFAAVEALRLRILALPTATHVKAGPVESDTQRSAAVLVQLLKDITAELAATKDLIAGQNAPRAVAFIDAMVIANNRFVGEYESGYGYGFVSG